MFEGEIKSGIEWLNKYFPGWFNHVQVDRLDMRNGSHCVIGQVFRKFFDTDFRGLKDPIWCRNNNVPLLSIDEIWGLGFQTMGGVFYQVLTREWKEKIVSLQS